ncbi:MAG: RrF2 family transcriptional regulator [Endomicrobiales bacterium]
MLKLSTRSKYGIRALIELASHAEGAPVRIAHISARQRIPRTYLEQILHQLNRAGIVESVRGPAGGYRMKKTPERISLGEIVDALERRRAPLFCLGDNGADETCARGDGCFSHFLCSNLDKKLSGTLNTVTLEKITQKWKRSTDAKKKSIS